MGSSLFGKRERVMAEQTGELTASDNQETPPEIGFEAVEAELKSVRKPRVSRAAKKEREEIDHLEIRRQEFLSGGVPRIVAKIYERGVDIASLVLLAGMKIPSSFYKSLPKEEDAELWARSCIEYTFRVSPERAEQVWLFVSVVGLPILNVGEGVMMAREHYGESMGVSRDAKYGENL